MNFTLHDLEDLARGSAFLGAGGGGDPYLGRLLAQQAVDEYGMPRLISVDGLNDGDMVFPVAFMGAPTVMLEKLMSGTEIESALEKLEQHLGKKATAVISGEIGGINSLIPIRIAAARNLPLVDGDGMGRAFPELPMTTFNISEVPCAPMVVANEHGEYTIINSRDAGSAEAIARQIAMHMGGSVAMSCYAMNGAQAKRAVVRGTLSLALGIGRAIAAGRRHGNPFAALIDYLNTTTYYNKSCVLFDGKIIDLIRETRRGFAMGRVHIEGIHGSSEQMEIEFQNENLRACSGTELRTIVPDLICILDRESAEPITTEGLKYGQRIKVMAVSAPPILRSRTALQFVGPRNFGYEESFQPLEMLNDLSGYSVS